VHSYFPKCTEARSAVQPLASEYETLLWAWVRERQVSAVHAWACLLGIDLHLTAYPGTTEFAQTFKPLSAQLVVGSDLDPASTDDLRHVVALATATDGFVVAGIQQTETPQAGTGETAVVAPRVHAHVHAHGLHDHSGVKGNAYNFASTPGHAASFDLLQGQLSGLPCFRTAAGGALGCVEGAFNWFASQCEYVELLEDAHSASLVSMLHELTAGWPLGARLAERCASQRHFLGYADGADNVRNPYLLRQLMGVCMFHGCREVALLGEADLPAHGVVTRVVRSDNVTLFA